VSAAVLYRQPPGEKSFSFSANMADKKKDEIMAKGRAEAAFASFQNDPKSASRPEGFTNNFPDLKTSWDSLNEKKRV
jgi:hypothetical protein